MPELFSNLGLTNAPEASPEVRRLFLSSTAKDLAAYRTEVDDVLRRRAEILVSRNENWIVGQEDVVEECRQRLKATEGYLGIFAYYYGWIPQHQNRSATHLEYGWAWDRWGTVKPRRLAAFMPGDPDAPGQACPAQKDLEHLAEELLEEYALSTVEHEQLLRAFHDEVREGRIVQLFKDKQDLRERAQAIVSEWNKELLRLALEAERNRASGVSRDPGVGAQVASETLGLLGRQPQMEALRKIVVAKCEPAVAILVHGGRDAGQHQFLAALLRDKRLRRGRPPRRGHPMHFPYQLEQLVQWVAAQFEEPAARQQTVASVEELAQLLHPALTRQRLVVALDRVDAYVGGAAGFQRDFWAPLQQCLVERQKLRHAENPFILIAVANAELPVQGSDWAWTWPNPGGDQDWDRLVALPSLSETLAAADIREWLDELDVPEADWTDILAAAMQDDPQAAPDPTTAHVLERLAYEPRLAERE